MAIVSNKNRLAVVKITSFLIAINTIVFSACIVLDCEPILKYEFTNFASGGILACLCFFLDAHMKVNKMCKWFKLLTLVNLIDAILCYLDDRLFYIHNIECAWIIHIMLASSTIAVVVSTFLFFKYGFCKI